MDTKARTAPATIYHDKAERDRIRETLLRYMRDNRFGVPRLQQLIADANGTAIDNIPIKTLQRFLGDTHRSNDMIVRHCARFAAGLPEADPVTALGDQLASFLGVWHSGQASRPLPADLAGSFSARAERTPKPGLRIRSHDGTARTLIKDEPLDYVPFSNVEIDLLPGRTFASVREAVFNWDRHAAPPPEAQGTTTPRRAYEGVVIHPNGSLFVLLRNVLTGAPRIYWLDRTPGNGLAGYGHEAPVSLDARPLDGGKLRSSVNVVLSPVEGTP